VTRLADALGSVRFGADWIGLNFHLGSLRRVDRSVAAKIIAALPAQAQAVGVFVDRPPAEVAELASRIGLRIVQLHGREPPEDLLALHHLFIIRAYRIGDRAAVDRMTADLEECRSVGRLPDAVLLDTYVPGQAGGTGQSIDANLLLNLPPLPPVILAGGLTPENVTDRIALVHPWMVDVASGVESAPGCKDPARIEAFLRAVRGEPW